MYESVLLEKIPDLPWRQVLIPLNDEKAIESDSFCARPTDYVYFKIRVVWNLYSHEKE